MSIARYQAYLIPVDFFPSRCRGTPKSSILGAKYCATGLCIIFLACIKQFSHLPVHLSIMVNLHSSAIYHLQMYQQVFRGHVPILSLITIYSRSPHLSLSTANGPFLTRFHTNTLYSGRLRPWLVTTVPKTRRQAIAFQRDAV